MTFWFPKSRSRFHPWRGHLTPPKRSLGRTWYICIIQSCIDAYISVSYGWFQVSTVTKSLVPMAGPFPFVGQAEPFFWCWEIQWISAENPRRYSYLPPTGPCVGWGRIPPKNNSSAFNWKMLLRCSSLYPPGHLHFEFLSGTNYSHGLNVLRWNRQCL